MWERESHVINATHKADPNKQGLQAATFLNSVNPGNFKATDRFGKYNQTEIYII